MTAQIETERKYLIRRPAEEWLKTVCFREIAMEQTYLQAPDGVTRRVRRREEQGSCRYILTEKRRISAMSCQEQEEEISEAEYRRLLQEKLPDSRSICKTRWCLRCREQVFEIDLYDFWQEAATMEVELSSEEETVFLPERIEVLAEVTGDHRFSNVSLSRALPDLTAFLGG